MQHLQLAVKKKETLTKTSRDHSWKDHINEICSKANSAKAFLKTM